MFEYGKYEFIGEIQEGSVCFGLRFVASATLGVNVENHAETIQSKRMVLLWRAGAVVCCGENCAATKCELSSRVSMYYSETREESAAGCIGIVLLLVERFANRSKL